MLSAFRELMLRKGERTQHFLYAPPLVTESCTRSRVGKREDMSKYASTEQENLTKDRTWGFTLEG